MNKLYYKLFIKSMLITLKSLHNFKYMLKNVCLYNEYKYIILYYTYIIVYADRKNKKLN